ncbi:MAG: O-acetyl-ADP-ribose deacetylase [Kofleriaceae bacterium]
MLVDRSRIQVVEGDITQLAVDAIVNAANTSLLGGGGVDGAIHRAAGPELLAECRTLGPCATGDAKITKGYRLPARYVIHAVGPVWHGGEKGEPARLESCYRRSLALAREHGIETIAFPAISTGVYRYPVRAAAELAVSTIADELSRHELPRVVTLCTFDRSATAVTTEVLDAYFAARGA